MTFKKLVLATAIAALPVAGFSVEILDDESMSGVTGQDGISVAIAPGAGGISGDIILHDNDGLTGTSQLLHNFAGAIVIEGFNLTTTGIDITVDAGDSVQNGGTAATPVLHIGVSLDAGTTLATGDISVANSERDDAGWDFEAGTKTVALLDSIAISMPGGVDLTMQLGNEPQGHMIELTTAFGGGLTLAGLAINDANSLGALGAVSVHISDAGVANADLGVDIGIDADATGLVVDMVTLGAGAGIDIEVTDAYLGSATPIGDVFVKGLNMDGTTITISGH